MFPQHLCEVIGRSLPWWIYKIWPALDPSSPVSAFSITSLSLLQTSAVQWNHKAYISIPYCLCRQWLGGVIWYYQQYWSWCLKGQALLKLPCTKWKSTSLHNPHCAWPIVSVFRWPSLNTPFAGHCSRPTSEVLYTITGYMLYTDCKIIRRF